ncbi:MAG: (2Fe-2S)-binding protein [Acidimicrobiia bacterium]
MTAITLLVNGRSRDLNVAPTAFLLDVLRDELDLTGAKECCLEGECGACTVMIDGRSMNSCLILAAEVDGAEIVTVEGLAGEKLSALQTAFLDQGAAQCGFCIPGQLVAAKALLDRRSSPTVAEVREALAGNLCRCGCYEQITKAVLAAAAGVPT